MVGKTIRDYIERGETGGGGKKLTVPGFGTFMRKDTGDVIFVDLLRKDDGRLRELVEDRGGYSEVEAMALVDRFIFETKTAIERSGSAPIEGFGTMFLDDKGLYQFDYSPKAKPVAAVENPVQEKLFGDEDAIGLKSGKSAAHPSVLTDGNILVAGPKPRTTSPGFSPAPRRQPAKTVAPKRSKKSDLFIIIAIVAAIVAIAVLVFGAMTSNLPFLDK